MAFVNHPFFWLTKRTAYDTFAAEFSETRDHLWEESEIFRALIASEAEVLDAGCGNGRNIALFESAGARVTAIDTSEKLLDIAEERNPHATILHGKLENLPCKHATFDAVFAIASLHHLPDHRARHKAFCEALRVLKPNGIFAGSVWNLQQERFAKERASARKRSQFFPWWSAEDLVIPWGKRKLPRFYHAFSPESLQQYLQTAGFADIEIFAVVNKTKAAPLLGKNICFVAKKPHRIEILQVPFDLIDTADTLSQMQADAKGNSQRIYTTPNPEICVYAASHPEYLRLLRQADVSVPDGKGVLWASEFLYSSQKSLLLSLFRFFLRRRSRFFAETVCGSDLFREFCQNSDEPIFLLGGAAGVAERCAEHFRPFGANIAGTDSGKATTDDDERIVQKINSSGAKVLFVAFGAPKQEEWIFRNRAKLPGVRVLMGVGGSFDFVAGTQKRAPRLLRSLGLEWLWRLLRQPSRFGRIKTAVWTFPRLVNRQLTK